MKKRCSVPGCESPHRARGFCSLHYQRWLNTGAPGEAAPKRMRAKGMMCTIDGCSEPVRATGLCSSHYDLSIRKDGCPGCGGEKTQGSNMCSACYHRARDATGITEKVCTRCQTLLPIEAYAWRKYEGGYKRRSWCRECEAAAGREYARKRRANPEGRKQIRAAKLKNYREQDPDTKRLRSIRASARRLGLDPDEIVRAWDGTGHRCQICGRPPGERRLCIDHCHESGRFRGFLCGPCNTGIGQLQDSPDLLRAAITYLTSS